MASRLEFKQLSKKFGKRIALNELTLALEPSEILGFLGPNGAGKTTAIHLALGFLRPSSGTGLLLDRPFGDCQARGRLGFVPDVPVYFAETAYKSVEFAGRLNGVESARLAKSIHELLRAGGVPDEKKDARKLSRGMQQRLAIAQALVNDPELLILDEPTAALDPVGVHQVREVLRHAREAGKSVFFSSHQLSEVEQLCDRVAFLNQGRLLRHGPLAELLSSSSRIEMRVRGLSLEAAGRIVPTVQSEQESGLLLLSMPAGNQRRVIEAVWNAGGEIVTLEPRRRSLEELFLEWSAAE